MRKHCHSCLYKQSPGMLLTSASTTGYQHRMVRLSSELDLIGLGSGWLAFNKPAGMSVHNAQGSDLITYASQFVQMLKEHDPNLWHRLSLSAEWSIYPVHRLDAATSGVSIIALTQSRARELASEFESRRVKKSYVAVIKGTLGTSTEGAWRWPLAEQASGRRYPQGQGPRQPAQTLYQVLATNRYFSLLNLDAESGRQHQLRRHCALARHPIIGDTRYGSPEINKKISEIYGFSRLALHAREVALEIDHHRIVIQAPVPQSFAKLIEPPAIGISSNRPLSDAASSMK